MARASHLSLLCASSTTDIRFYLSFSFLPQNRGLFRPDIIKFFFEWQTLDVLMIVVSHPPRGVPRPPSLLTVNSHLCITFPKSRPQIIHLMLIEA